METLDDLHDLVLRAPNASGQMESMRMHRLVLAAASPYAKAMLGKNGTWKETTKKKVPAAGETAEAAEGKVATTGEGDADSTGMVEVDFGKEGVMDIASLQAVAAYIYTGATRVQWGAELLTLARVADYLGLGELTERCVEAAVDGVQHDGAAAVEMLVRVGSSPSSGGEEEWMERIREASMGHVLQHFGTLSQTEGFMQHMKAGELAEVLGRDELQVKKEEEVFEAVVGWMGAAGMERGLAEAEAVLPFVRFPQMALGYVTTRVALCQTGGIGGSALLKRLTVEAMTYKAMGGAGSTITREQAVADGFGEESARTRPREGYMLPVDAMTMECGQVMQTVSSLVCMVEVGEWVVSGHAGGSMRVWDARGDWTCVKTVEQAHDDSIVGMTTWQGMVVTCGCDHKVKVWEAGAWRCTQVLEGHTNKVWSVAVLDEATLLSSSWDKTIRVWDTATWTCRREVDSGHTRYANHLAVLDGMVYCAGGNARTSARTVRVLDASTWECVDVLRGHTGTIYQLLVWQDKLISVSDDKTIKVWSTGGAGPRQCEHTLEGHTDKVFSVVVCGDKLVSGSTDKSMRVWNTETWACERVLPWHHTRTVSSLLCTGDGEFLVSGGGDRTMRVWAALRSTS